MKKILLLLLVIFLLPINVVSATDVVSDDSESLVEELEANFGLYEEVEQYEVDYYDEIKFRELSDEMITEIAIQTANYILTDEFLESNFYTEELLIPTLREKTDDLINFQILDNYFMDNVSFGDTYKAETITDVLIDEYISEEKEEVYSKTYQVGNSKYLYIDDEDTIIELDKSIMKDGFYISVYNKTEVDEDKIDARIEEIAEHNIPLFGPALANISPKFDPDSYEIITYEDIMRDRNGKNGTKHTFYAEVMQYFEDGDTAMAMLLRNGDSDMIYQAYFTSLPESRLVEGDNVDVYGTLMGLEGYETVRGNENTTPVIYVDEILVEGIDY